MPVTAFPADELPLHVQHGPDGRRRKTHDGRGIDLAKCELLGLVQYDCRVIQPDGGGESVVGCWPVQRLFRRCQDKKGHFMVETTAWEAIAAAASAKASATTTSSP